MREEIETILENKYPEYKLLPIVDDITAEENPREDFWDNLSSKEMYDVNAEVLKQLVTQSMIILHVGNPVVLMMRKKLYLIFLHYMNLIITGGNFKKKHSMIV